MIAEERDGANASRQDTSGKDYLLGGRRMQSELRLPKCAAERTHRGKMRTEKKAAFAVEVGRCMGCACRSTRWSERIAARYGRKRLPSWWKEDAVRAALAEERGEANASRQDMGGKENCLRSGRRTPVGLRLPKHAMDWTHRGKIGAEKTAFAMEGGCCRGYDCRSARRRSLTGVLRQLPGWHFCVYSLRPAAAQSEQSPCSRSAQSSHSMAPHTGQPRKERASAARWHMAHSIIDIQNTPSQRLRRRGWPGRFPGRLH